MSDLQHFLLELAILKETQSMLDIGMNFFLVENILSPERCEVQEMLFLLILKAKKRHRLNFDIKKRVSELQKA